MDCTHRISIRRRRDDHLYRISLKKIDILKFLFIEINQKGKYYSLQKKKKLKQNQWTRLEKKKN